MTWQHLHIVIAIKYEREFARLMPWRETKGEFCRVQIEGMRLQEGRSRIQDMVFSRRRPKLEVTSQYHRFRKCEDNANISKLEPTSQQQQKRGSWKRLTNTAQVRCV